ncbi:MAG: hypothetical protein HQ567_00220, partial [Candidatus Nealsonbacteria bacterium]|nr:hypothetical protein [Candidatus Nealsonbacteria bacterium]
MKKHTLSRMIIVAGMVLACGTMAMAADETITWTGAGDGFIGSGNNFTPDLGNNTVAQRHHFVIDNSTINITRLSDNNTWLDDGTTVDPTDPAVGSGKWGGKSMELSGTGYISNQAFSKNGLWNVKTFRIGEVGVGFLNQSGGTLDLSPGNGDQTQLFNSQGELRIGGFNKNDVDWNGIGTYTMTGGLLTNHGPFGSPADATGWVRLGESGTGTLSIGGTATVDLIEVSTEGVVNPSLAAITLGANVVDTGTNNALLEIIGTGATVNIDTLAMMGGFTNTIKFGLDGGAVSPINVAGGIADADGVGVYIAAGGWIEITGYEDLASGAVIDLIDTTNGFFGAETLSLGAASADHFLLGLDGTGKILQATAVSSPDYTSVTWDNNDVDGTAAGDLQWETGTNWDPEGTPSALSLCTIDNGDVVDLSGTGELAYGIELGATIATTLNVTGDLTVSTAVNVALGSTLTVDGTLTAQTATVAGTLAGSGTINVEPVEIEATGTVAPGGDGIGDLTIGEGELVIDTGATYNAGVSLGDGNLVEIAADRITLASAASAIHLGGTLAPQGVGRTSADFFSAGTTLKVVDNSAGGSITGTFTATPAAADDATSHIGQGAFLRDVNPTATGVDLDLFVALGGDADGDGK